MKNQGISGKSVAFSCQRQEAGIAMSAQQVIELLAGATMTILEQDKAKKTLFLRLGTSANTKKNNDRIKAIDELLHVVGIEPLAAIEDSIGLARKFKLSPNMKLVT